MNVEFRRVEPSTLDEQFTYERQQTNRITESVSVDVYLRSLANTFEAGGSDKSNFLKWRY